MPARRIVLLSAILVLLVFNWWHFNRVRHVAPQPMPVHVITQTDNLWSAYDNAANLRDAPSTRYDLAADAVTKQSANLANPNLKSNADALSDVRGCMVWLQFYRQTVDKPNPDPAWRERTLQHIQSCKQNHADIAH